MIFKQAHYVTMQVFNTDMLCVTVYNCVRVKQFSISQSLNMFSFLLF